ncbi:MAG TPA: UDP-N-acetyl glucosamine 2-epimerase [Bacteroidetes bacterium]|nr:UDP-N-acetyl glucosamine 2-epimerase [Bacteroidota bacterium]
MKVFLVAGARPNFMKIAPVYRAMQENGFFDPVIVHTGQHYDAKMSKVFFEELELPEPHIYLGVGSGTHAEQTAEIMKRFEPHLTELQPDLVMVVGDVNSTVACSLVAAKVRYPGERLAEYWQRYERFLQSRANLPGVREEHRKQKRSHAAPLVAHIEAGLRSFDFDMPEEINRIETDHLSDILFTTCDDGDENLLREGVDPRKIFQVGNVMIDSLRSFLPKARQSGILQELNRIWRRKHSEPLTAGGYALVTLHRPSNVDHPQMLRMILSALMEISGEIPVIFPMHPRTQKLLAQLDDEFRKRLSRSRLLITDPIGYLDFLYLEKHARIVLTDSGGVQEETSYLGVPCLTLRPNTERPVTIREGTNRLVPLRKESIVEFARQALQRTSWQPASIRFWDGRAAQRIVGTLTEIFKPAGRER